MKEGLIKVLLIDDDEDDYLIVKDMLSVTNEMTFELHWTSTAEESFRKMEGDVFDVCLLDYRLGNSDGLQVLGHLRQRGIDIPVVFLTGYGNFDIAMKAMELGASDYLEKGNPDRTSLERVIRYAIERFKSLETLQESERKLRLLSAKLIEVQENERKILARDLHDSLGASMTAVKYALEQKLSMMDSAGDGAPGDISLEQIIEMLGDTIEESHRITSNLRPLILDDLGLIPAIRYLCRDIQKGRGTLSINQQVEVAEEEVPEQLKIAMYRITQEALNNAAKYSAAHTVQVKIRKTPEGIELLIQDEGRGFDPANSFSHDPSGPGMGLLGMKERAELSGGSIEIRSETGEGTVIRAHWPGVAL